MFAILCWVTLQISNEANSPRPLTGISFSCNGQLLCAAAGSHLYLVDSYTGDTRFMFETGAPEGSIPFEPAFSPDSQYLLSGGCFAFAFPDVRGWPAKQKVLVVH